MSGKGYRVLILSASAGTGHLRAADALEAVGKSHPEVGEVRHVDALTYTNKLFRDFYSKLYIQMVRSAPTLLGWWYDQLDEPWRTAKMRLMLNRLNTRPLIKMIREFDPDITICTHFLPAEIISYLITEDKVKTRLSIVITDFDVHGMWLCKAFHRYFVAIDESRAHLLALGIPEKRITVSGIPVDPRFGTAGEKLALRRKHGLDPDLPVILLSAGALSVGPAEYIVRALSNLRSPAQIAVICGKNEELKARVQQEIELRAPPHLRFIPLGYTTEMHEWMGASDLFLGKPGGLTTSEALATGLPMVVFKPIPGQEERNSDHLLEQGAAIRCNQITTLAYKIDTLLSQPSRLKRMAGAARRLGRPQAAQTVIDTLVSEVTLSALHLPKKRRAAMVEATRTS